jgi:hypothetical protein
MGTEVAPLPEVPARYVILGAGGVGGLVLRLVVPFLHAEGDGATVTVVDGDSFEESNRGRMIFGRLGPKAVVLAEELAGPYGDRVNIVPVPEYLTAENAPSLISTGDVVFCQPDNHATRRIVERHCANLAEVALFSGGNDGIEGEKTGTYGNVQVYLRRGNRDLTNRLSAFHPEIAEPADALPTDVGCAEAAASAPQLLFTNAAVASAMLAAYYAWRCGKLGYEEVYLDILNGRSLPVQRELLSRRPRTRVSQPLSARPTESDQRQDA